MRNMDVSFLRDLNFTIVGGFIERTNHKMHAVVITRSPSVEGQRISESIGIDKIELWSDAIQISDTASEPTIFSYIANYTIPPARTRMFGMPTYGNSIPCTVKTTLRIHLAGSIVEGDFDASLTILVVNQTIPVTMRGALVANLQ
ncbi:MAG TPA: hypothetical protein VHS05_24465 [Pyrinomonadaceae bacterium]|nr:hypothetical protein [Pyrinomonadaceae bacterium]